MPQTLEKWVQQYEVLLYCYQLDIWCVNAFIMHHQCFGSFNNVYFEVYSMSDLHCPMFQHRRGSSVSKPCTPCTHCFKLQLFLTLQLLLCWGNSSAQVTFAWYCAESWVYSWHVQGIAFSRSLLFQRASEYGVADSAKYQLGGLFVLFLFCFVSWKSHSI